MTSYFAYSFEIADNDTVTSINHQNLPIEMWDGDNLYPELAAAGYPLTSEPGSDRAPFFLVRTNGKVVAAFTAGEVETVMPAEAADVFLRWYRINIEES